MQTFIRRKNGNSGKSDIILYILVYDIGVHFFCSEKN